MVVGADVDPLWQVVDRQTLIERSGEDPYVMFDLGADAVCLVGPLGWAAVEPSGDGRAGAVVVPAGGLDDEQATTLIALLDQQSAAAGLRLAWASLSGQDWPHVAGGWLGRERWVWMSTRRIGDEAEPDWHLVELDDDTDAAEINDFALPLNPLFEGDPGQGKNLFWLGVRDGQGALIGCGTAHRNAAGLGHLAGFVVDPRFRRRGMGRALVLGISRRVLDRYGVTSVSAYADNHGAIALYRGVGYHLDHTFQTLFREQRR